MKDDSRLVIPEGAEKLIPFYLVSELLKRGIIEKDRLNMKNR